MTTRTLSQLVEDAAVIDPDTLQLVVRAVGGNFGPRLMPLTEAQQLVADATKTRFVGGRLEIHSDGKRYQFPEVTS